MTFAGNFAWLDVVEKLPKVKARDTLGRAAGHKKDFLLHNQGVTNGHHPPS
ncbi:MAG: hypothetical protein WD970_01315 [Patescibacteria group bacterium]